jgi:uncharacterized membrane protein YccF (DUF307 family)
VSLLGNLVWIVFGGWVIFLEYLASALLLAITVVGIPAAVQCLKLAVLGLAPFGREVVAGQSASGCVSTVLNIVWLLTLGLCIAITHVLFALIFAITIVGIPFAKQYMKIAALSLTPFGKEIR